MVADLCRAPTASSAVEAASSPVTGLSSLAAASWAVAASATQLLSTAFCLATSPTKMCALRSIVASMRCCCLTCRLTHACTLLFQGGGLYLSSITHATLQGCGFFCAHRASCPSLSSHSCAQLYHNEQLRGLIWWWLVALAKEHTFASKLRRLKQFCRDQRRRWCAPERHAALCPE